MAMLHESGSAGGLHNRLWNKITSNHPVTKFAFPNPSSHRSTRQCAFNSSAAGNKLHSQVDTTARKACCRQPIPRVERPVRIFAVRCSAVADGVAQESAEQAALHLPEHMPLGGRLLACNKIVVDNQDTLDFARRVLFEEDVPAPGPAGHLTLVGLDCEWRPDETKELPGNPVALMQVVTRTHAFLIDTLFWCAPEGGPEELERLRGAGPEALAQHRLSPRERAIDAFLQDLMSSPKLVRVAFMFGYDVHRLRTSYPHLPALQEGGAWGGAAGDNVVEILKLARKLHTQVRKMRKRRPPLKDIHKRVLKTYMDKEQQCSDWAQRPLTQAQVDYAAKDGHSVVMMLDHLVQKHPSAVEELWKYSTDQYFAQSMDSTDSSKANARRGQATRATVASSHAVDIEQLLSSQLGKLAPASGQAAVVKVVANLSKMRIDKKKFSKNFEGVLRWRNTVMVFATVDKLRPGVFGMGKLTADFTNNGQQLVIKDMDAEGASSIVQAMASTKDGTRPVDSVLLYCRTGRTPYLFCGRLHAQGEPGHLEATQSVWTLADHASLVDNTLFNILVASTEGGGSLPELNPAVGFGGPAL